MTHPLRSACLVSILFLAGCGSPVYVAAPTYGKVVDAETGEPIAGAIVIANWQLVAGSFDGPRQRGQLEVKETVTDRDGRFRMSGFIRLNPRLHELRDDDPQVLIFKPGYQYKRITSDYIMAGTLTPGPFRWAAVNGETVSLKRLEPSYFGADGAPVFYSGLSIWLDPLVTYAEDCEWEKIFGAILQMDMEKKRLESLYPGSSVRVPSLSSIPRERKCKSVAALMERYK
jgi:hypothetical protein